ncbi:MAG: DNRLRE domain-containing protein [Solirubrobacterales bacterium]
MSLPARMGAGPVRIDFGDEWLSSELSGPSSEPVQLEGQAASYEAANPGVTFSFSSLANGVKEEIEIAGPSEPSAFSFELSASLGLTPLQGSNGEITFLDGDNNAVAVLPAPLMTDSTPTQPAVSQDVYYELEALSQQRWRLTVKADREWLEQPERIWPVVIDPTVAVKSPALDCTIFGGPHETYSGFCGAFGWGWNRPFAIYNTNEKGRSLLRFDLSSIPSDAHVADATLGLHAPAAAENTAGVQLRRITNIWNYQVTWR